MANDESDFYYERMKHLPVPDDPDPAHLIETLRAEIARLTAEKETLERDAEFTRRYRELIADFHLDPIPSPRTEGKIWEAVIAALAERRSLKAALRQSQARIYPDTNYEKYLDEITGSAAELVEEGDDWQASLARKLAEAIGHLRRTRDELRVDLERIGLSALSPAVPPTSQGPSPPVTRR